MLDKPDKPFKIIRNKVKLFEIRNFFLFTMSRQSFDEKLKGKRFITVRELVRNTKKKKKITNSIKYY